MFTFFKSILKLYLDKLEIPESINIWSRFSNVHFGSKWKHSFQMFPRIILFCIFDNMYLHHSHFECHYKWFLVRRVSFKYLFINNSETEGKKLRKKYETLLFLLQYNFFCDAHQKLFVYSVLGFIYQKEHFQKQMATWSNVFCKLSHSSFKLWTTCIFAAPAVFDSLGSIVQSTEKFCKMLNSLTVF